MPLRRAKTVYQSLRFRLTLWNAAVVFVIVVATLIVVHEGLRYTLYHENDSRLEEDLEELGAAVREVYPNWTALHEEMNRKAVGHAHRGQFVQVLNEAGEVTWSSANTPEDFLKRRSLPGSAMLNSVGDYRVARKIWSYPDIPVYNIRVGSNTDTIDAEVAKLTGAMSIVGLLTILLAPIGGYLLAGRATQPLAEMHRTAASLRPNRLSERLPIRGTGDELDKLSATINGLLDRINAYLEQNRQFIANAAHELRSPLAAIQSSVEVALNSERSPEEYQEVLAEMVGECSDLRSLVNQLLLLAESDNGMAPVGMEPVNVKALVDRCVEIFQAVAEERGITLTAVESRPLYVAGHEGRLRQVLTNLIDNGIKFNRPGGLVTLQLHAEPYADSVVLEISDTGLGIPEQDLPHVFDRFFRGDKSRNRDHVTTGTGLGLSIVQAIVKSHGGQIEVRSEEGAGATFQITLPRQAAPKEQPQLVQTA